MEPVRPAVEESLPANTLRPKLFASLHDLQQENWTSSRIACVPEAARVNSDGYNAHHLGMTVPIAAATKPRIRCWKTPFEESDNGRRGRSVFVTGRGHDIDGNDCLSSEP